MSKSATVKEEFVIPLQTIVPAFADAARAARKPIEDFILTFQLVNGGKEKE